jgi:hypothetical protein
MWLGTWDGKQERTLSSQYQDKGQLSGAGSEYSVTCCKKIFVLDWVTRVGE